MPTTVAPNGSPNSFFINEVRRILRDQAAWFTDSLPTDGTNGVVNVAGSKPFRLQRAPIVGSAGALSAPSPTNAGLPLPAFNPIFDATAPAAPTIVPALFDGGAGGTWAAGTYVGLITYTPTASSVKPPAGESLFSVLSNSVTIVANRQLQFGGFSGIPSTVAAVSYYIVGMTAATSIGGLQGGQVVVGGTVGTANFAGPNPTVTAQILPMEMVMDTGEMIFPLAPASGTLSATYQSFRYSDAQILDALTEGLKSLWPDIWQENTDTSLTPAPYLYEYTLPAVFNDPRVQILMVEIRDPNIFIMPYKEVDRYTRPSLNVLFLADLAYSPAGNIRITYNAPYGALSDVEVQTMHLPVYFAVGRLLADQEAMRSRQDELVPLTGEGSSQSGVAQQTSAYWFALYEREKARFARYIPSASTKYFRHWSYSR